MNSILKANVLGAKRYDINGNKMASLFLVQETDQSDENVVGHEVMKLSAPYNVIEQIKSSGVALPAAAEVTVQTKAGSGGKLQLICLDVNMKKATTKA